MHGQYCLCIGCYPAFHIGWVKAKGFIDFSYDGDCADIDNGSGCCDDRCMLALSLHLRGLISSDVRQQESADVPEETNKRMPDSEFLPQLALKCIQLLS